MVAQPSDLQKRAEAAIENKKIAEARYMYIRAFEDYAAKGLMKQSVECGTKATALYYKENYYNEAFDLLRRIDQTIVAKEQQTDRKAALQYYTAKERMQMYVRMHRSPNALEQLNTMERKANESGDENLKKDLLYNKTI
jgi:hypothetical protein